jgi:hypothetical protein
MNRIFLAWPFSIAVGNFKALLSLSIFDHLQCDKYLAAVARREAWYQSPPQRGFSYCLLAISRQGTLTSGSNFAHFPHNFLVLRLPRLDLGACTADSRGELAAGFPLPATD